MALQPDKPQGLSTEQKAALAAVGVTLGATGLALLLRNERIRNALENTGVRLREKALDLTEDAIHEAGDLAARFGEKVTTEIGEEVINPLVKEFEEELQSGNLTETVNTWVGRFFGRRSQPAPAQRVRIEQDSPEN